MATSAGMDLGAVARAATWDGHRVWCLAGARLAAFEPDGALAVDRDGCDVLRTVAAGPDGLVAVTEPGILVWLDGSTGDDVVRRAVGGDVSLVGGRDGLFVVDVASERAWPVTAPGTLGTPVPVPGVDRAAAARGSLWWTSRADTVLRSQGMDVELGVLAGRRGGIVGCAGSVWVSGDHCLLRVGAWGGDTSPPLPAPFGPVGHLACGDGRVLGGSREGLFVLDPSIDADVRRLDLDFELDDDPAAVVATKTAAWVFPSTEPLVRVVPYR